MDEKLESKDLQHDKIIKIDFVSLTKIIWKRRKFVGIWCLVGAVIGLIIAFSIPKSYTTSVILAPENASLANSSSLGALAAMASGSGANYGTDAVYPKIYPDVLNSIPFCLSLFDVPLTDKKGKNHFTLEEYLKKYTKKPWWSPIIGLPGKIITAISPEEEITAGGGDKQGRTAFKISKQEEKLIRRLQNSIILDIDGKTDVMTISVSMQDPVVSALLADTVVSRLQEYITEYRTNKARKDLEYVQMLNDEAKEKYYKAQQKFADYLDANQGVIMFSARTERDRLENEATLAFNVFNQTEQHLQLAKAKVQEQTPVYAIIQPASIPLKPSSPKKLLILIGMIILSFMGASAWIIFIEPNYINNKKSDKEVAGSESIYETPE